MHKSMSLKCEPLQPKVAVILNNMVATYGRSVCAYRGTSLIRNIYLQVERTSVLLKKMVASEDAAAPAEPIGKPQTVNPKPQTLSLKPQTPNLKP